jgi:hypothetical protein
MEHSLPATRKTPEAMRDQLHRVPYGITKVDRLAARGTFEIGFNFKAAFDKLLLPFVEELHLDVQ